MDIPALANDKYRATLRSTYIDGVDTALNVTAIPPNLPTIVTVGWKTDYETKFRVEGTSGTNSSNYALTGITKISGYEGNIPENSAVNCLNNEDFFNQWGEQIAAVQEIAETVQEDSLSGWVNDTDTWVYVSASTFKIVGKDVTAKFSKGTRLKFTQTTVKYAVVIGSAFSTDTTVTIAVNTDYTIANAVITAPAYSYQASPQGYPTAFTTSIGKINILGKVVNEWGTSTFTAAGAIGELVKTVAFSLTYAVAPRVFSNLSGTTATAASQFLGIAAFSTTTDCQFMIRPNTTPGNPETITFNWMTQGYI